MNKRQITIIGLYSFIITLLFIYGSLYTANRSELPELVCAPPAEGEWIILSDCRLPDDVHCYLSVDEKTLGIACDEG